MSNKSCIQGWEIPRELSSDYVENLLGLADKLLMAPYNMRDAAEDWEDENKGLSTRGDV